MQKGPEIATPHSAAPVALPPPPPETPAEYSAASLMPTPAERAAREAELAKLGYAEEFTHGIDRSPEYLVREPTAEEAKQVAEVQRLLDADGVAIPRRYWEANHFESRVSLFNRYVVANDGHVRHAKDMLVADIHWRDEIKMLELQRLSREAVTGVPDALFTQHYRTQFLGFFPAADGGNDSPVVYRCLTHMKTWELMEKGCTVEALVKHELWLHEQESRLLFTHPPSFPCRGLVVIIDISHMTMKQATKDILSIFSGFAHASKPHHPERLTKLYVVGAPRLFSVVWKMLVVFIPRQTYHKIEILSSWDKHPFLSTWMKKVQEDGATA